MLSPEKFRHTSYEIRHSREGPTSPWCWQMPLQSRYVDNLITSSPEKFTKTSISSSSTGRDVFGRLLEGFSPKRLKFIGSYTKHKNHN